MTSMMLSVIVVHEYAAILARVEVTDLLAPENLVTHAWLALTLQPLPELGFGLELNVANLPVIPDFHLPLADDDECNQ